MQCRFAVRAREPGSWGGRLGGPSSWPASSVVGGVCPPDLRLEARGPALPLPQGPHQGWAWAPETMCATCPQATVVSLSARWACRLGSTQPPLRLGSGSLASIPSGCPVRLSRPAQRGVLRKSGGTSREQAWRWQENPGPGPAGFPQTHPPTGSAARLGCSCWGKGEGTEGEGQAGADFRLGSGKPGLAVPEAGSSWENREKAKPRKPHHGPKQGALLMGNP